MSFSMRNILYFLNSMEKPLQVILCKIGGELDGNWSRATIFGRKVLFLMFKTFLVSGYTGILFLQRVNICKFCEIE